MRTRRTSSSKAAGESRLLKHLKTIKPSGALAHGPTIRRRAEREPLTSAPTARPKTEHDGQARFDELVALAQELLHEAMEATHADGLSMSLSAHDATTIELHFDEKTERLKVSGRGAVSHAP